MSPLISLRGISKAYGARALFASINLTVHQGQHVGLIGANGSGKSTLMRIMAGLVSPDTGMVTLRRQARTAYLSQKDEFGADATVEQAVAAPLKLAGTPLADVHTRTAEILSRTGFADPAQPAADLSGGWRKRLALARALVQEPDVLLLDEPTNHLDLDSVLWLEKLLGQARFAFVLVSHDRAFLENVTTRTVELSRAYPDGFLSVNEPYSGFLEKRQDFMDAQAGLQQALASKVRREVEWLRRGAKARTTKAKARIGEAGRLIDELARTKERNAQAARAGIDFTGTARQTKRLVSAEAISKAFGEKSLFEGLTLTLSPGSRLGLVGANGSGKSTLMRVLAGEERPDAGEIRRAPALQVAYFDQSREKLDPGLSLKRTFDAHGDSVVYRGRSLHVASWAKRFLFKPEQLDLPVGELSGGEQARLLIARLMLRPADVLFLDEPTNDLDIPTLEVLEESLADFPGAVVLISHDRYLLDTVSTVLLGLDAMGGAEFFADFAQWETARRQREEASQDKDLSRQAAKRPAQPKPAKKLTYKEQREFDGMETAIAQAEQALARCTGELENPAIASDHETLQELLSRTHQAQDHVDALYARWAELEAKQTG